MSKTHQERDKEREDKRDATEIKPTAPRSLSYRQGQVVELFLSSSPSVQDNPQTQRVAKCYLQKKELQAVTS